MAGPPDLMTETPNPPTLLEEQVMEALSDIMHVSQITGAVYLHAQFSAPWCLTSQILPDVYTPLLGANSDIIPYHYIMEGRLRLRIDSDAQDEVLLEQGDVIMLPHNQLHRMGSDLDLIPVAVHDLIQASTGERSFSIRHGGHGEGVRMVCGFLGYAGGGNNPLISLLPPYLKLNFNDSGRAEWIRSTFQYAADEVDAGRFGTRAMLAKLSELLFNEAIRQYAGNYQEKRGGWVAALRDPYIARSLAVFHANIARPWTVEELAREVGLSRSAVAGRFARTIGMAPMRYLSYCRMQVAAQKLASGRDSLSQIADAVGYDSEAAFSRAFKSAFGSAPATWRRMSAAVDVKDTQPRFTG
jgi:AraC-like DNA-binding protein